MIPDYCVPDLAQTVSTTAVIALAALVMIAIGSVAVVRRRRGVIAAVMVLAFVGVGLAANVPGASASAGEKSCPAGYHYDVSKDSHKTTKPMPAPNATSAPKTPQIAAPRSNADESWMTPQTTFTLKMDGSSGLDTPGDKLVNWDIAKKTIRAYMNAPKGIANKKESPYIHDVTRITEAASVKIADICRAQVAAGKKPAAVFDADDTTLWTYDMEDSFMNFNFTVDKQNAWFAKHDLPATPGMVKLVKEVRNAGCEIIGLTGRKDSQKEVTLANLARAGYVDEAGKPIFTADKYFTKFDNGAAMPEYLVKQGYCEVSKGKCSTVAFKAGTRRHIQDDLGYVIAGNFGDQWSDLQGGAALEWVKLPNATYYLPSKNLNDEWEAKDRAAGMSPSVGTYTLAADGSSGSVAGVKDTDIPNMDVVKATIRSYYNAKQNDTGVYVSNKMTSPYITEMEKVTSAATDKVVHACRAGVDAGKKPAITLDADDTTVWTYDMEEAMEFNFTPEFQKAYLESHDLPATPGMVKLVTAAKDAGCEIIGLTGRSTSQKAWTLRNLFAAGYPGFIENLYFTKPSSDPAKVPSYVTCAGEKCTTIEFKSGTRSHIEKDLGYTIVGNFGDQYSDLIGGHADMAFKLPNPTYYLP